MLTFVMRCVQVAAFAVVLVVAGCGGSGNATPAPTPTPSPTPTPAPSGQGTMSASIDGVAWSATVAGTSRPGQSAIGVGGQNGEFSLNILISNAQVGSHRFVTTLTGLTAFGQLGRFVNGNVVSEWNSGDTTTDEGVVTIDTLSANRITGTFAMDLRLYNGAPPQSRRITNGHFDLPR